MSQVKKPVRRVIEEVCKVVSGKNSCVEKVMIAMIAKGHVLLEDIPGVGKTTMALAFAGAMELEQKRVQFTPDILPSDVTGFSMYDNQTKSFRYVEGPVMTHIFLADEINRTSPKTQSALLEVMEEGIVTVDGRTMEVPRPFFVIATQNPVGSAGTQSLPESQMDRFMISMSMGYPTMKDELHMLKQREGQNPLQQVCPVLNSADMIQIQQEAAAVYIHDAVYNYILKLVHETRNHDLLNLGISPRGTMALCSMAKGTAYLKGRDYVVPSDVEYIFLEVASHRVQLERRAKTEALSAKQILGQIMSEVQKPVPKVFKG